MIRIGARDEAGRAHDGPPSWSPTVALVACLTTGTASADHQTKNGGVHWGRYRWANTVASTERVFWLFDRTGNPTMNQAIQQWVQSWNGQRNLNVRSAPAVMYLLDNANVGQCENFSWPGYSFMTFCAGDPGTTGIASLTWIGGHIVNPYVIVRPGGLNYGQLFTAVTHEMGHVMGLVPPARGGGDDARQRQLRRPDPLVRPARPRRPERPLRRPPRLSRVRQAVE